MSEPAVSLKNVTFSYNDVPVLEDVTVDIPTDRIASIIGPNGGGKTTLLKIILGLYAPDRGEVRVFGMPPAQARPRIGYMPQHPRYDPQFPVTVREVVLMGRVDRQVGGRYSSPDREAARAALRDVHMEDLANRAFDALSGGQRQRVLIARALACDPDLLLLDEPTANVDLVVESRFYEILEELSERMTILMVSHDLGLVSNIVQQVICVNRHVVTHPTSEVTGDIIREMYGSDHRLVRHNHGPGLETEGAADD